MSGKDEVGIRYSDILGIVGRMRQQIERIAHAGYQNLRPVPLQCIHTVFQQMNVVCLQLAHNVGITGLIVIIAQHHVGTHRHLHRRQGGDDGRHILTSLVQIATHQ